MTTVQDLRQQSVDRINRLRRIHRLLESEIFDTAWTNATPQKQREIRGLIYIGDDALIEAWLTKSRQLDLELMSLRQLRERASKLGLPYYARLSKLELIWGIQNAVQAIHDRSTDANAGNNGFSGPGVGQDFQEELRTAVC